MVEVNGYKNTQIPSQEYFDEMFRVSKNQIIWGGNYFTDFLPPTNSWIVWNKKRDATKTYMSEGELAWTSFNTVVRIVDLLWDGARKCENVKKVHPHQKPIKLYDWVYKNFAKKGDKILDTHLGSGNNRIAAYRNELDFVGFENDEAIFNIHEKHFKRQISKLELYLT